MKKTIISFFYLTALALWTASFPAYSESFYSKEFTEGKIAKYSVSDHEDTEVLSGEAALNFLRQDGSYASLGKAMTAARYGMREVEGSPEEAWAQNPKQQLQSRFDQSGLSLTIQTNSGDHYPSRWELKTLAGKAVPKGSLDRMGQKLTLERTELGLTEWYINRPSGLEHGFTLKTRPETTSDQLELTLAVTGTLVVQAAQDGQSLQISSKEHKETLLNYNQLKVWDAEGNSLTARMETNAAGDEVRYVVEDHSAAYPLTIDPTFVMQEAYLKASNSEEFDEFGDAIAISGDTIVVGAIFEGSAATGINGDQSDNSAGSSGAAYVFVRSGNTWSQQAYLKASNTEDNDRFGFSVAISGDTIVVGTRRESSAANGVNGDQSDNSAISAGAAYVFVRSESTWSQQAYLKASNSESLGIFNGDEFGFSVAISGDTIVVGAFQEDSDADGVNGDQSDNSVRDSGAAYVFSRSGSTWSQQAYLKASNSGGGEFSGDGFGFSVAIGGDTIVVGAVGEESAASEVNGDQSDNSTRDSGAAYVFVRSGIGWSQQAYLKASNSDRDDFFGTSVAISGDTIVVGATFEDSDVNGVNGDQSDNSALESGAAYVFVRSENIWSQEAYIKASNSDPDDRFGESVAISGDTIVVGASRENSDADGVNGDQGDNSAEDSGAAYVFMRSGSTWSQVAYLKASNSDSSDRDGDRFGTSVAISEETIVVGAFNEASSATGINGDQSDNSAFGSGAAYVFTIAAGGDSLNIISSRILSNGDFEITLEQSVGNLTVERSNDLSSNSFSEIDSSEVSINGAILTISASAVDPEGDGISFFRVLSE